MRGVLGGRVRGIVHCGNLDGPFGHDGHHDVGRDVTAQEIIDAQRHGCISVLDLARDLAGVASAIPLFVLTRGAQAVRGDDPAVNVAQAPAWGLVRTLRLELPELRCALVDLDPSSAQPAEGVASCLLRSQPELDMAIRAGRIWVPRLVPRNTPASQTALAEQVVELAIRERGSIDNLAIVPAIRRQPAAGEVEIRVQATGLNFRDVLNVLGCIQAFPAPLAPNAPAR